MRRSPRRRVRAVRVSLDRGRGRHLAPLDAAVLILKVVRAGALGGASDTLFACFPGGGAKYNSHYDGGPGDPRKLTCILYVNERWRREDGGELMLFDAGAGCWRSG